jgi:polar amino acid transport system substrate-binding protein
VLTDKQNMSKLIVGRIEMVLIDKRMAHFILRNSYPKKLNSFDSTATLKDESYYLAISKNAKNYKQKRDAFNLGLPKLKENGVLEAIIKKYN